MKIRMLCSVAVVACLALPMTSQAQGTLRGAEEGAAAGGNAGGPVGAIVGGAIGAATGTVGGTRGVEDRPRFREYVVRERHPSYTYRGDVRAGVVLPKMGWNTTKCRHCIAYQQDIAIPSSIIGRY